MNKQESMKKLPEEYWLLFMEYRINREARLENDVIQLCNNVAYRRADALDHLEMIQAQERLAMAREIFGDIYRILAHFQR